MNIYEQRLRAYLQEQHIQAEHLSFDQPCHSVAEAARAVDASPEELVKNICLLDSDGQLITAIVKGEDRVSVSRIAKTLQREGLRLATPAEILGKTGYPCGGTPSFGYQAMFLIDPKVMEREIVFTGGGSETSLIKMRTEELVRANQGTILRIRKYLSLKKQDSLFFCIQKYQFFKTCTNLLLFWLLMLYYQGNSLHDLCSAFGIPSKI